MRSKAFSWYVVIVDGQEQQRLVEIQLCIFGSLRKQIEIIYFEPF